MAVPLLKIQMIWSIHIKGGMLGIKPQPVKMVPRTCMISAHHNLVEQK